MTDSSVTDSEKVARWHGGVSLASEPTVGLFDPEVSYLVMVY
jgi:hypothetical protein